MLGSMVNKLGVTNSRGFSPASLFASGEEGVWYDPSDLSTLFESAYGTTPATTGNRVGLVLDKSKGLVKQLIDPSGTSGGATYTASTKTVVFPRNGIFGTIHFPATVGEVFKISGTVTIADTATSLKDSANPSFPTIAVFDSFGTYSFDTYFTCLTQDNLDLYINDYGSGSSAVTITGLTVEKVLGNHAIQTNSDKCPVLRLDDQSTLCLDFTTDDGMRTPLNVPFGTKGVTDMSLFAGCRKESAGLNQTIMELSDNLGTQKGCFRVLFTSGNLWRAIQKGGYGDGETAVANILQTSTVGNPNRTVLSSVASITAPSHSFKRDGSIVNSNASSLGTGTFGDHLLNIGARQDGLSANLDGKIYGIIVRGAFTDADTRIKVDKYLGLKSGVSF